ncbi:MAG: histidine kinase [Candidatus Dormibacteria bacterium]
MLAVSVIPLALFSAAGITALSGLNHGALSTADRQLVASQSLHLAALVQSKAAIVNDELASIEDQIGLLGLETGGALTNSVIAPTAQSATSNVIILGPGSTASVPTEQVLALQSLENSASAIAQLHPEVADVWLQLPGSGLLEISPSSAVTTQNRSRFEQLLPSQDEYQLGVKEEQAADQTGAWRQLVSPSPQAAYWTPVYSNPMAGGQTVTVASEGVTAAGLAYRVGANITVRSLVANFLVGPPGSAQGSYAFLLSGNGTVITVGRGGTSALGIRTKGKSAQAVSLTTKNNPWLGVGSDMTLGQQGQQQITLDGTQVEVYYSPLPASRWSLGVAIPVAGLDGSVVGLSQQIGRGLAGVTTLIVPVLVVLAVLVVAFTNVLSRRLVEPLSRLTRASERIASGDLQTEVEASSGGKDEIGTLERTLDEMRVRLGEQRDQIEAAHQDLERRVEARTTELTERNEELATLNSVTGEMSRSLVVAEVAATAARQLGHLWDLTEAAVYLTDGLDPTGLRLVGRSDDSATESTAAVVAVLRNLDEDQLAQPRQFEGLLVVPLITAGAPVGYLTVLRSQPFLGSQLELLQVMGGQLALALRNAQLFADTQELATTNERNRIAREIHDTLAQGLTGIILQLQAAEAWLGREPSRALDAVEHAGDLARSSLQEARRSVWDLRPEGLERAGLAGAVRDELARIGQRSGTKTSVQIRGLRGLTLAPGVEVAIFRVIQEAVANSMHHAHPKSVRVEMTRNQGQLRVTVTDDGSGFQPTSPRRVGSFGITSMTERAVACGGTLELDSTLGGGTQVVLRVPCAATSSRAGAT